MDTKSELENTLELFASQAIQQGGLNFSSLNEAQNYLKKIKTEIRHLVEQGNKTLIKGLTYLATDNQGRVNSYVANVCAKLLKQVGSSKKLNKIVESDIIGNENSLLFFSEAVERFIECGDLEQEQCVLSVLMALFPKNPQPYIFLGSSIWRNEGIDAAAVFYLDVLKVIPNPAIYYFAAECFYKKGDKDQAREFLHSGLKQARTSPELYHHIEQLIAAYMQKI
jgi:tetratricopeptide (TPR) repeat protein